MVEIHNYIVKKNKSDPGIWLYIQIFYPNLDESFLLATVIELDPNLHACDPYDIKMSFVYDI